MKYARGRRVAAEVEKVAEISVATYHRRNTTGDLRPFPRVPKLCETEG
jgi:hypothetical protein